MMISSEKILKIFDITKPTMYSWIKNGALPPPNKIGGKLFWRAKDIKEITNLETHELERIVFKNQE